MSEPAFCPPCDDVVTIRLKKKKRKREKINSEGKI
jgi:hypothetical protein